MVPNRKPASRLYVTAELETGGTIGLSDAQAHQLRNVLRLATGASVALFNGRSGEFVAELEVEKRRVTAHVGERRRPQDDGADIWLAFSPVKHERLTFMIEKASELGASRLMPVITARTQNARVNAQRLGETAREAAEQCERLTIPQMDEPRSLATLIAQWDASRRLFLCAEAGETQPAMRAFAAWSGPSAVLVGPEGGFSPGEFETLRGHEAVVTVSLGATILRTETAATAALACWQAAAAAK